MHPCTLPSYLTSHTHILGPGIPLARGADPDPVILLGSGSGFQISLVLDPDPVCYKRLDSDPVNIGPDPQPWGSFRGKGHKNFESSM